MCVTSSPAIIHDTRTFVTATEKDGQPFHVSGYQNKAVNVGRGGNCMFLNFAGTDLQMVHGPEHTSSLMQNMTSALPSLELTQKYVVLREMSRGATFGASVQEYGDYTVVLAQEPDAILDALDRVPAHRRPPRSSRLEEMVGFYASWYPEDSYVLGCFSGEVEPTHPITVGYTPRNPDVLTIPGLDGHDGEPPTVGAPIKRGFRVAFASDGCELPHQVNYWDKVDGQPWAPSSVAGFYDNRSDGPNGDYVVPLEAVKQGLTGKELAATLL